MSNFNSLRRRSVQLDHEIEQFKRLIEQSPKGSLISRKKQSEGYDYYNRIEKPKPKEKRKEIYIPQNQIEVAKGLALREYAEARLKDAEREKRAVDLYLKTMEEEKSADLYLKRHPGAAELVIPELRSRAEYVEQWANADYIRSKEFPEDLIFQSSIPDLKVRSKSETIIIDHYIKSGVPFRYEEENMIDGIAYHPDFTCLNPRTLEIIYWEHQGRRDDKKYVKRLPNREEALRRGGIIPWKNLIITTETLDKPLDPVWVDVLIEYFLQ